MKKVSGPLCQPFPAASDRTPNYQVWSENGRNSTVEIAKKKTAEILATHRAEILDEKACEEIDRILEKARKFYMQRGMM